LIEPIAEMPAGTIGFRLTDELTDADYSGTLEPALREAASSGGARLLLVATKGFELGSLKARFEGARSDPDLDLGHRQDWKRVAIVADAGLLFRRSFPVWSRIIPVDVKLFSPKDEADAKSWVAA
jgi:hypothetical protein